MGRKFTIATCALNQWSMDFKGNLERILKSCREAKEMGAAYRLGPELEITGYTCEDHFLENDTIQHSWEMLGELIKSSDTEGLICDFGMPVLHKAVRYNCRVIVYNTQIILIRPKLYLAMDHNYREGRWFTAWTKLRETEEFTLPQIITDITGQTTVPFGTAVISTRDTIIGTEICEELFTSQSPHTSMGLDGVEVFTNGSGSHFQLRKIHTRMDLIKGATEKVGGVYVYSNFIGCDGGRLYFDGCCLVAINGEFVAQGSQFTLADVEVTVATVDLDDVTSFRANRGSRGAQVERAESYPRCHIPVFICQSTSILSPMISINYHMPEEEIMYGPSVWLWDYLRRSNMSGFFLPLSGGIDSSSTACLVGSMCDMVLHACHNGNSQVIADLRRVMRLQSNDPLPATAHDMVGKLFTTCYMASSNSSVETKRRAATLASQIGSRHITLSIDDVVGSCLDVFQDTTHLVPKFKVHGGSNSENLALQNVQARSRMVLSYLFAQLMPWTDNKSGSLLVLGSANVDESLYGYFTKYDCSSADINPIGGISKTDLRGLCKYMAYNKYPVLKEILSAAPTAELEPITESYQQTDEDDMGFTYSELSDIGRLRKCSHCGPYSMFTKLLDMWGNRYHPREIADKVKRFFHSYSMNRHKMTVLTPSYHAERYSPDDNRHDLRQFLYNTKWEWQFSAIDKEVLRVENEATDNTTNKHKQTLMKQHDVSSSSETNLFVTGNEEFMNKTSSVHFTESPHPTLVSAPTINPTRKRSSSQGEISSTKKPSLENPKEVGSPSSWMPNIFNRKKT